MAEKLPQRYEMVAGTLSFQSGTYKGKSLMIWDAVGDCEGEFCPVYNRCPFERKTSETAVRCAVQLKYVKSLTSLVLKRHGEKMTQDQIYYFGMQIVPLASQLVKFKLIEASLGIGGMFQTNNKGAMFTHPVYKEIRQTIESLNKACSHAAIDPRSLNVKRIKPGEMTADDINDIYDIDTDYYERMSQTEKEYKKAEGNANSNLSFNYEAKDCIKEESVEEDDFDDEDEDEEFDV